MSRSERPARRRAADRFFVALVRALGRQVRASADDGEPVPEPSRVREIVDDEESPRSRPRGSRRRA